MKLAKLFGSNCRVKILEKFIFEHKWQDNNAWFFIRELCRNIDEQINSVRRELINLEDLNILRSKEENKKKFYFLNTDCHIFDEIIDIFVKNFDAIEELKKFFKWRKKVDLIAVNESIQNISDRSNNVVDIFIIWEIDKIEFNNFLGRTFFWKKIKYAVMTDEDFRNRLEYNDKLILNILNQKWNIFLKDKLNIRGRIEGHK